jgi:Mn2+/Fe2+ NRAMP family transporter
LLAGALVILIPGLPLNMIAVFTQIAAAALLIPDMIFLVLLTSDHRVVGAYANRWWKRLSGWGIVLLYTTMAAASIGILMAGG